MEVDGIGIVRGYKTLKTANGSRSDGIAGLIECHTIGRLEGEVGGNGSGRALHFQKVRARSTIKRHVRAHRAIEQVQHHGVVTCAAGNAGGGAGDGGQRAVIQRNAVIAPVAVDGVAARAGDGVVVRAAVNGVVAARGRDEEGHAGAAVSRVRRATAQGSLLGKGDAVGIGNAFKDHVDGLAALGIGEGGGLLFAVYHGVGGLFPVVLTFRQHAVVDVVARAVALDRDGGRALFGVVQVRASLQLDAVRAALCEVQRVVAAIGNKQVVAAAASEQVVAQAARKGDAARDRGGVQRVVARTAGVDLKAADAAQSNGCLPYLAGNAQGIIITTEDDVIVGGAEGEGVLPCAAAGNASAKIAGDFHKIVAIPGVDGIRAAAAVDLVVRATAGDARGLGVAVDNEPASGVPGGVYGRRGVLLQGDDLHAGDVARAAQGDNPGVLGHQQGVDAVAAVHSFPAAVVVDEVAAIAAHQAVLAALAVQGVAIIAGHEGFRSRGAGELGGCARVLHIFHVLKAGGTQVDGHAGGGDAVHAFAVFFHHLVALIVHIVEVAAIAAHHAVRAFAAVQGVVAAEAHQGVVARAAGKRVVAVGCCTSIIGGVAAIELVGRGVAHEGHILVCSCNAVAHIHCARGVVQHNHVNAGDAVGAVQRFIAFFEAHDVQGVGTLASSYGFRTIIIDIVVALAAGNGIRTALAVNGAAGVPRREGIRSGRAHQIGVGGAAGDAHAAGFAVRSIAAVDEGDRGVTPDTLVAQPVAEVAEPVGVSHLSAAQNLIAHIDDVAAASENDGVIGVIDHKGGVAGAAFEGIASGIGRVLAAVQHHVAAEGAGVDDVGELIARALGRAGCKDQILQVRAQGVVYAGFHRVVAGVFRFLHHVIVVHIVVVVARAADEGIFAAAAVEGIGPIAAGELVVAAVALQFGGNGFFGRGVDVVAA